MEQTLDLLRRKTRELMTRQPKTVEAAIPAVEALALMEKFAITGLLITAGAAKPMGGLLIHDLLKAGLM
jgi:arabinose-5-phosphate isomerase